MRVVITGHTQGIGRALARHFEIKRWDVVGLSRSNGYDIERDVTKIVGAATGCDLFINNAYRDKQQLVLFNELKDKVGKIICMGSISRQYPELIPTDYVHDKQELYEAMRLHSLTPDTIPSLHLDLSFIENTEINNADSTAFTSDNHITFKEITSAVDFWLDNPKVKNMEFEWKCTPFVRSELERINPNLDPSRITY